MPSEWNKADQLLDRLIALQRDEQEAILQRKPSRLPELCQQIEHLVADLEAPQDSAGGQPPPETLRRLHLVHEIAQQNHLLIEHHLRFLHEVVATVLPGDRQSPVYNIFGRLPAPAVQAGSLLNART
jgi:hypothetical protein